MCAGMVCGSHQTKVLVPCSIHPQLIVVELTITQVQRSSSELMVDPTTLVLSKLASERAAAKSAVARTSDATVDLRIKNLPLKALSLSYGLAKENGCVFLLRLM